MKKLLLIFAIAFTSTKMSSSVDDYIYPYSTPTYNDYGALGLVRMPSARFYEAGTLAINWSEHDPYTRGAIIGYPFSWMEASWQCVECGQKVWRPPLWDEKQALARKLGN